MSRPRSRLTVPIVLLVAAVALPTYRAAGQNVLDAKAAAVVRDEYMADLDTLHAKIMALAIAIPEDKYSWRPSVGVRSVSEVLMHVATEYYFWVPGSVGGTPPADFGRPRETIPKKEKITAKSEVLAELSKSWAYARTQVTSVDASTLTGVYKPWGTSLPKAAFGMTGDLHEHLGQLISYARSVGVKPPWSK
ncbi:MAG: DinB family protein [Gemmatimonadaceae bacterium]